MKRYTGPLIAALGACALIALFVFGLANQGANTSLDSALAAGRYPVAPDRTLPVLGAAGSRSLASWRGHPVVLNFWASWCTPCEQEAPVLERTQQQLAKTGAGTIVGVTWQDTSPDSLSFVKQYSLTYPNLRDVGGNLANAYGTRALPETFVIDGQGRVVAISRGEIDQKWLTQAVGLAQKT